MHTTTLYVRDPDHKPLTQREENIILLVVKGRSNRDVATQLFISVNTVKFHLKNIYNKLGVRSRTQAAWLYNDHQ